MFVAEATLISFNHGFDILSNCEGYCYTPSEAKPHPLPYSELATALVKLHDMEVFNVQSKK